MIIISIIVSSAFCWFGSKFSEKVINNISRHIEPTALHWKLLRQILKVIWGIIYILLILDIIPGADKLGTTLVACSSVFIAALGLASQDALGNAIDGVFISFFKPFSVGDRVRLVSRNMTGTVIGINLRYTTIKTVENNILMIPNSIMNDEIIENSNIDDKKIKSFIDVSVDYDSDIKLVKRVIRETVSSHPLFVDSRTNDDIKNGVPKVGINIRNFGTNGVEIRITICAANISDSFNLSSDVREMLLENFSKNNIKIPYTILEIKK